MTVPVPFLDLKAQYRGIREEIAEAIQDVLDNTAFAGGPAVKAFEEDFAPFCGCKRAVGVANGTDALLMALLALDIGPGDEVITVANTFIATAEAISFAGAKPVFVDIEEESFNMDPEKLEAALTDKTKAVIPVHLYGQAADMDPILAFADKHGLKVIEDASQAHGAQYKGKPAGSMGDAGCFSFYPGKNLGAYGEAGAVATNDENVAARIARLRDHGQDQKYYHAEIGMNGRMDGIQGAVLKVKLNHLPKWTELRRRHAQRYNELLSGVPGVKTPKEMPWAKHVYHLYEIRVPRRDELLKHLADREVFCGIHYPVPLHLQEAYRFLGLKKGAFPAAEKCAGEILSLPMFPELSDEQIQRVAGEIKAFG
jgi:dTDP-4-amino-4,6-dideoxygalactose transaminase